MALRRDHFRPPRHTRMLLPMLVLLLPLALSCVAAAFAELPPAPRQLLRAADSTDVCASVREISAFASAHCNASDARTATTTLDARCTESFSEFARDSEVFNTCEARASRADVALLLRFKELYSAWQQTRVCELFHAREKQAARECAGDNVHRPWNEATWPLFCHETFASYRETRKELDALCTPTADSPAFWEAYADYIASPMCKTYYDYVRAAVKHDCGAREDTPECVRMFEWYGTQQRAVETDCLELHNTRPFYRGFYRWKRSAGR